MPMRDYLQVTRLISLASGRRPLMFSSYVTDVAEPTTAPTVT